MEVVLEVEKVECTRVVVVHNNYKKGNKKSVWVHTRYCTSYPREHRKTDTDHRSHIHHHNHHNHRNHRHPIVANMEEEAEEDNCYNTKDRRYHNHNREAVVEVVAVVEVEVVAEVVAVGEESSR